MNIQFYINNVLADYKDLESLPFVLDIGMRDFLKIGNIEGIKLGNVSNILPLPASKTNKGIFENKGNGKLSLKVVKNGSEFFNGLCFLKSKTHLNDKTSTLNVEILGGNSELIERLDGVSLRGLALGNVTYSNTAVVATWTGGIATNDVIYAPIIYGKLNSETTDVWRLEDFKPHVYYETILNGIGTFLGVTIQSNLRSSAIWKQAVHLYGVGNEWATSVSQLSNNQTANGSVFGLLYSPTLTENVLFDVEFNVPTGGSTDIDNVVLTVGSFTETLTYLPNAGIRFFKARNKALTTGDDIEIRAKRANGTDINLPNLTTMKSVSLNTPTDGSTVSIASCLHEISCKDWLKEMFTQFNLIAFYNPIIKVLRLDSVFDFRIGSTLYEGFVKLDLANIATFEVDKSEITETYKSDFDKLRFGYKRDKIIEKRVDKKIDVSDIPTNGAAVTLSDGDTLTEIKSIYENVFNGTISSITSLELPLLLDESFEVNALPFVVEFPTFETEPKNALVTGETGTLEFETTDYTNVPILRQNNLRYSAFPFTLTFSDSTTSDGTTCKGLLSMFYSQYFSVLNDLVMYKADGRIKELLDFKTFTNVGKINEDLAFLTKIENVGLKSEIYECTYIAYRNSKNTDSFVTPNNPTFQKQILDIN